MMSAEDKVLKLLKDTNKPYHVQGVSDMLASQGVKKMQADKALASLAEMGKIKCKEFGKTKIYYPSQEGLEELGSEEKAAKLAQIKELSQQIKAYDESIATLKRDVAASNATLTLEELQAKFKDLQKQSETLNKKIALHRSGTAPLISAKDVSKAEALLQIMVDSWSRRRRIFMNIWDAVSENIDGKQADIFEDIGIETDESVGESLSNLQKLLSQSKKAKR